MSKKEVKTESKTFTYRNFVDKPQSELVGSVELTSNYHLERGENWDVKVVEDRATDWKELANKDVDKVGLSAVLAMAQKGLVDPETLAFNDSEALDLGALDPMDPQSVKTTISKGAEAETKLKGIAEQLGVSVDKLVESFLNGSFADLVAEKTKKEGEENA